MAFEIAAIDAFHVSSGGHDYWQSYRSENRAESARYVLKPGWRTAYGKQVDTCIMRVTLRSGQVGWGEATEPIVPEVIAQLATELIGPLSRGTSFDTVEAFTDFAYDLNRGRGHVAGYELLAIAALDIALCDALAKEAGKPLAALFGATPPASQKLYLSGLRRATLDERAAFLAERVAEGFVAAKLFVDANSDATIAEIAGLKERVPGDWDVMVDALWSYDSPEKAADFSARLADFEALWFECPLVPEAIADHCKLRRTGGAPVALGETFFTAWQLRDWLDAEALDVYQPDVGRTGFAGGVRQAKMVRDAGVRLTPHMGSGSPVVQAAALHFHAAECGELPCEFQIDLASFLPDAFASGWRFAGGRAIMPDAPGLGVAIDEDALAKHVRKAYRYAAD
jgi:galactonate dehydratase